ncbi:MAG: hypothetical protein H0U74_04505 [Bradymonadaceae bacterium]|nr:hypothetical protein [Lujinxingiaceae bacterium]
MSAYERLAVVVLVLCSLASAPAWAQYVDPDDSVRFSGELENDEFMILMRARAVKIPDFMLGLWFDRHASHWGDGPSNMSYGAEFVWRKGVEYEFSLGIDYADLSMHSDFWLESGKSATSAEFTEIDMQIVSVVFSTYWFWDVQPWFSPFVGGGIGPGIILGDIVKYKPRPDSPCYNRLNGADAYSSPECLNANGQPNESSFDVENPKIEDSLPPVVPMINVSGGARFNVGKHAVLKLETGFYTYLFAGVSLGGQW